MFSTWVTSSMVPKVMGPVTLLMGNVEMYQSPNAQDRRPARIPKTAEMSAAVFMAANDHTQARRASSASEGIPARAAYAGTSPGVFC